MLERPVKIDNSARRCMAGESAAAHRLRLAYAEIERDCGPPLWEVLGDAAPPPPDISRRKRY